MNHTDDADDIAVYLTDEPEVRASRHLTARGRLIVAVVITAVAFMPALVVMMSGGPAGLALIGSFATLTAVAFIYAVTRIR